MEKNKLAYLTRLRTLVAEMEADLGLGDLKESEKKIYLAAADCSQSDRIVEIKQLLEHRLSQDIARPTFYRALKNLEAEGKLVRVDAKRNVLFRLG